MSEANVQLREVGPRDGLQAEDPVPVDDRVRLVEALVGAGLRDIEACSFVSPTAVPAMAGAADVMARVPRRPGVQYWALVPNVRGAELAMEAGLEALTFTVSASPAYNEKNVGMSVDRSVEVLAEVRSVVGSDTTVDAVVSCAFGSPYEGDISPAAVAALGEQLVGAGATMLTFADTTGMATPRRVRELLDVAGAGHGLHLHDTRGTALVNAFAALEAGASRFDCAIGGLGGSPFAAGAGGNLATEDFVHLLDDLEVATGASLDGLLAAAQIARTLVGHDLASRVSRHGPRSRLAG